ncbi:MAG: hypothetical protein HY744_12990 [Deltaproteobacteria bacterium]|nr:hypothetical protein [Deltaproteobacteria bacterium]
MSVPSRAAAGTLASPLGVDQVGAGHNGRAGSGGGLIRSRAATQIL